MSLKGTAKFVKKKEAKMRDLSQQHKVLNYFEINLVELKNEGQ